MKRSAIAAALTLLLTAFCGAGCGGGQSPSAPAAPNVITLTRISPASGTKLTPGASVTFTATLAYMLNNAGSAEISMVIEDQNNVVLNDGNQPTTVVSVGRGSAVLSGTFIVPAAGVTLIQVLFSLTPNTSVPIPVVAEAGYPVGR